MLFEHAVQGRYRAETDAAGDRSEAVVRVYQQPCRGIGPSRFHISCGRYSYLSAKDSGEVAQAQSRPGRKRLVGEVLR